MAIGFTLVAAAIIFGGCFIMEKVLRDFLPSITREAVKREKETIALTIVRDGLNNRINANLEETSNYTRRRIERQLERMA